MSEFPSWEFGVWSLATGDSSFQLPVGNPCDTLPPMSTATATRRWLRPIYFVLGLAFLGIGIVGAFVPLIPTTGPLLLAAYLLARSSTRVHSWLMNHPLWGRFISDFYEGRGIPRRTKVVAVIAMTAAFGYTIGWVLPHPIARAVVGAIAVWAIWYVLHQPTSDL